MANTHIIHGIKVKIFLEERTSYERIKILLSNRESASLFDQPKFNMEGVSLLEAAKKPAGYSLYRFFPLSLKFSNFPDFDQLFILT